jgi:hypothetical protein
MIGKEQFKHLRNKNDIGCRVIINFGHKLGRKMRFY